MLVSPKWQTMWMESQHCSKSLANMSLASQQANKILEDLKSSCCSPNKAVQLEALKCWGTWINNQNPDDWKLNTLCYTAVRPLLTKKLQPLHKDVDVCKLKLSLMWGLLIKVQHMMQLEGPQYILEVFLQSCLTWLSTTGGDGVDNDISTLIFQLILAIFKKDENLTVCDKEMFPPLSTEMLHLKKVFHRLADKFLNIFIYWRKVQDKSLIIKIWNHFLQHCEHSCEYIPIPVWHKVFKLAAQICSERSEPVKDRLAFLHGSATNLKSVLLSSKFIDYGNLLTTPCEALLKKLVELCSIECEEFCDREMFSHSREICQVLSEESAAVGGYDLCIFVLDALEEFSLRSLYWGVWCGLVHCYKIRLMGIQKSQYTKTQMKFYRKLRGVALNFELDKEFLDQDCVDEVQKHICILKIRCVYSTCRLVMYNSKQNEEGIKEEMDAEPATPVEDCRQIVVVTQRPHLGQFSMVPLRRKATKLLKQTFSINFDLIKNIFKVVDVCTAKSLLAGMFSIRFLPPIGLDRDETVPKRVSLHLKVTVDSVEKEMSVTVSCAAGKPTTPPPVKKGALIPYRAETETEEEEMVSTPKTRSKSRAEEEELKKEMESQKRKKRKSFEVLVQEIVRKNKLRKTEKNNTRRKSPVTRNKRKNESKTEKRKNKTETHLEGKEEEKRNKTETEISERKEKRNKTETEISERKEKEKKNKKEEPRTQKRKENKMGKKKNDGKLENYFKVITKTTGNQVKKEEPTKTKKMKKKKMKETNCCTGEEETTDRKGEIAWRQTSLKTMMNKKEKARHGMRTRNNVKPKTTTTTTTKTTKNEKKLLDEKVITKMSPFKEVFHDHEYTKIELPDLRALEWILSTPPKEKPSKVEKKESKEVKEVNETKDMKEEEKEVKEESKVVEESSLVCLEEVKEEPARDEQKEEEGKIVVEEEEKDARAQKTDDETGEEFSEVEADSERRGKKRVRILDSLKPSKKIKLGPEEEPPEDKLEVIEKENLESLPEEKHPEFASPSKEGEKTGTPLSKGSPKMMNGSIFSRALRMIALVPESTKGSQVHWDSQPKAADVKCKKAPNVDKNSRASKMLALLSDQSITPITDLEDFHQFGEDTNATPNNKTPTSTLKSPKSIKKRRSIRFDDAKNETVLYQTDTPPSQIHMEKEKCRRNKPLEVILSLP